MKVLWITNQDVTTEPIVHSLDYCAKSLGITQIIKNYYTQKSCFDVDDMDVAIYMGGAEMHTTPPIETFQEIRKTCKTINLCCDATCAGWTPILEAYYQGKCFDITVNIDGKEDWVKHDKDMTVVTPIDPRYFNDALKWEDRPVLLGFSGGIDMTRRGILNRVGTILTVNPNRVESFGSYPSYANFIKSCKFVMNINERNTVKGRAIEVGHAGACLVEQRRSQTNNTISKWFDEKMFLLYDNPESIGELICENYEKAASMANAFQKEIMEKHSAEAIWKSILERIL